jgi:leucyl-tRNA synthetase
VIPNPEPFAKLFHQGMVLGPDGHKMSKRRGNVITPQEVAEKYSADAFRVYVMFMGPLEGEKARSDTALQGVKRFLDRVQNLQEYIGEHTNDAIDIALHKAIQGVTDDIEKLKLNTAVSKMMIFVNEVYEHKTITRAQLLTFAQLLAPYATKLSQQLWEKHGGEGSVHYASRPIFDPAKTIDTQINLPVQINGKMKGTIAIAPTASQEEVISQLHNNNKFAPSLTGEIKKIIFVPGKIINLIVG